MGRTGKMLLIILAAGAALSFGQTKKLPDLTARVRGESSDSKKHRIIQPLQNKHWLKESKMTPAKPCLPGNM